MGLPKRILILVVLSPVVFTLIMLAISYQTLDPLQTFTNLMGAGIMTLGVASLASLIKAWKKINNQSKAVGMAVTIIAVSMSLIMLMSPN